MVKPGRYQISLGQIQVVIAIAGVALVLGSLPDSDDSKASAGVTMVIQLAGAGVVLRYIRLSGWMWLIAVSLIAGGVVHGVDVFSNEIYELVPLWLYYNVWLFLGRVSPFLLVMGLLLAFRDVRRKLASRGPGLPRES
jgi:hypothetical protein